MFFVFLGLRAFHNKFSLFASFVSLLDLSQNDLLTPILFHSRLLVMWLYAPITSVVLYIVKPQYSGKFKYISPTVLLCGSGSGVFLKLIPSRFEFVVEWHVSTHLFCLEVCMLVLFVLLHASFGFIDDSFACLA